MLDTFENLDFSAGGDYEPTTENFPWAKKFFHAGGVDATNLTIEEIMSGAKYDITLPGSGMTTEADAKPSEGGMLDIAVANPCVLAVGVTNSSYANKFQVGSGDGWSLDDAAGANSPILTSTGNAGGASSSVAGTAYSIAADLVAGHFYAGANHTAAVNCYEGGSAVAYNALATVFALHSGMTVDDAITITNMENFVGFLVFSKVVTTTPDWEDALHWMQYQWSNGNYWLYPPWRGLAE